MDKGNSLLDPANGIAFAYTFPRAVKSIGRPLLVSRTENNRDPRGLDAAARLCYMEATFYMEATSAPRSVCIGRASAEPMSERR